MIDALFSAVRATSTLDYGVLVQRYGPLLPDDLPLAAGDITPRLDGTFDWGGALRAVLVPCWDGGDLMDVVAFDLASPMNMWRFTGKATVLYGDGFEPVAVWPTVDAWLRHGCAGQVLLDWAYAWTWFVGARLQVEDHAFAESLRQACRAPTFPATTVAVQPYKFPMGL